MISYDPLRRYLKDHKISTAVLSENGISTNFLSNDDILVKTDKIARLCEIFGIGISDVIEWHEGVQGSVKSSNDRFYINYNVLKSRMSLRSLSIACKKMVTGYRMQLRQILGLNDTTLKRYLKSLVYRLMTSCLNRL